MARAAMGDDAVDWVGLPAVADWVWAMVSAIREKEMVGNIIIIKS